MMEFYDSATKQVLILFDNDILSHVEIYLYMYNNFRNIQLGLLNMTQSAIHQIDGQDRTIIGSGSSKNVYTIFRLWAYISDQCSSTVSSDIQRSR